ncbi:hypothetical protein SpCBS45565_g08432 [Spizellomyces sp. 'palustris']|nr:hypothetical protein SpCBS45565_g08432 [Spizellomyces sp. 'palustris']
MNYDDNSSDSLDFPLEEDDIRLMEQFLERAPSSGSISSIPSTADSISAHPNLDDMLSDVIRDLDSEVPKDLRRENVLHSPGLEMGPEAFVEETHMPAARSPVVLLGDVSDFRSASSTSVGIYEDTIAGLSKIKGDLDTTCLAQSAYPLRYRTRSQSPPPLRSRSRCRSSEPDVKKKIGIDEPSPCDTSIPKRPPLGGSMNYNYDADPSDTSTSRGTASSCRMEQVLSALEEQASAIQSLRKTLEGIKGASSEVNWETFGGLGGIARRVQKLEGTMERLASNSGTPVGASLSPFNESELCPERHRGRSTSIEIIPSTQVRMGDKEATAEIPTTYMGGIPKCDDLRTLIARTVEESIKPMIDDAKADLRRELIRSMPSPGGHSPQDSSIIGGKISAGATDERCFEKLKMDTMRETSRIVDQRLQEFVTKFSTFTSQLEQVQYTSADLSNRVDRKADAVQISELKSAVERKIQIVKKEVESTASQHAKDEYSQISELKSAVEHKIQILKKEVESTASQHAKEYSADIRCIKDRIARVEHRLGTVENATQLDNEIATLRSASDESSRAIRRILDRLATIDETQREVAITLSGVDVGTLRDAIDDIYKSTQATSDKLTCLEDVQRDIRREAENMQEEMRRIRLERASASHMPDDAARPPVFNSNLSSIDVHECVTACGLASRAHDRAGAKRPAVIPTCGTGFVGDVGDLRRKLDKKVDTVVLEELMRHIPTRDEVKRLVQELVDARPMTIGEKDVSPILLRLQRESTAPNKDGSGHNQAPKSSAQMEGSDASREWKHLLDELLPDIRVQVNETMADKEVTITHNLEMKFIKLQRELLEFIPIDRKNRKGDVQHIRKDVENKVRKDLKAWLEKRINHIREETIERIKKATADVREDINNVASARDSPDSAYYEPPYENVSNQSLEDEGITPHSALDRLSRRLTREFDEKLFLLCSDLSTYRDNFLWDKDQTSIRIGEPGLYEITFAFFTKAKPSVQLVVNGESVLSAINSPSYVVHHSSGFVVDGDGRIEPGTVTGISLLDFLALPPKSTLSVHYHGGKKGMLGHGFLGLRKL